MTSNTVVTDTGKVEAYPVSRHARMGTLPRHFGEHMMTVEGRIYGLMREYCADCSGGYWQFHELSNGGFYMVPCLGQVGLYVPATATVARCRRMLPGSLCACLRSSTCRSSASRWRCLPVTSTGCGSSPWGMCRQGRYSRRSTEGA
jgi:hypothetical protein